MYPFSLTVVLLLSDISVSHIILPMSFVERCFSNKTTTKRSKRSTTVILYLIHANDVSTLFPLCVCVFFSLFFFLSLFLLLFSASIFHVLLCLYVALSNVCVFCGEPKVRLLYGLLYRVLLKCFQLAVAVFTWLCAVYLAYESHWQAVPSLLNVLEEHCILFYSYATWELP